MFFPFTVLFNNQKTKYHVWQKSGGDWYLKGTCQLNGNEVSDNKFVYKINQPYKLCGLGLGRYSGSRH